MRSRFLSFTLSLGMALLCALPGCATVEVHSRPGTTTTVVMTRHADRDEESSALNAKGLLRAEALADAVATMGVTAIYSPNVERNLATVRPLAKRLGIEITRTPAVSVPVAGSIVKEILERHAGGVVVVVGNISGNLQLMYHLLGGTGTGPVEYGDLSVLTIPDHGPVTVIRRRYGP